jgi:hypothetical protein
VTSPHTCQDQKSKRTSVGKDVEKREPLHVVGGNVNYYSQYGKQHRDSSKNKTQNSHMILLPKLPANLILSMCPKEMKSISERHLHSHVHCIIIHNSKDIKIT